MYKVVLIRHGESTYNKLNKFTGWTDVDLDRRGVHEAHRAGKELKKHSMKFDIAFTSVQKRAVHTTHTILNEINHPKNYHFTKIEQSWKLNERHYGALQGLNKSEMAKKFGEEQVHIWRRSYSVRPPAISEKERKVQHHTASYASIPVKDLPACESLKDVVARVIPYWEKTIVPCIKSGQSVIISAHGNSLRALIKHLDKLDEDKVLEVEIPTGIPLIYELDKFLKPQSHYYLGNKRTVRNAIELVKSQGKAK